TQVMPEFAALLSDDGAVAAGDPTAQMAFLADRARCGQVPEIDGISAGGMPIGVKCLHALVRHARAAGPRANPIGDAALARSSWSPDRCQCEIPGTKTE